VPPIRMGIVGVGKIARDQHIPCIAAHPEFELAAVASRNTSVAGVPSYTSLETMLAAAPSIEAVAICTPPQTHYELARLALEAGCHVLMEKPPCASLAQLENLVELARSRERTLYQTWHSQHARGVAPAARLLEHRKVERVHVTWKEDVRRWHPGQTWLWQPGGFGVFDPGMNALSILTKLIPERIFPRAARLWVPVNCSAPIAADLELTTDSGLDIHAEFDFRQTGPQCWNMDFATDAGALRLCAGGGQLALGDAPVPDDAGSLDSEYAALYRRFGELVPRAAIDVDARPLRLVADLFLIAQQIPVQAFTD
jgi:D-galactose 1-dehydrogenase